MSTRKHSPGETAESKLPREVRPMKFDPDLASALEALLEPFSGKKLEAAQDAVVQVRNSSPQGTFEDILTAYSDAVSAATGG